MSEGLEHLVIPLSEEELKELKEYDPKGVPRNEDAKDVPINKNVKPVQKTPRWTSKLSTLGGVIVTVAIASLFLSPMQKGNGGKRINETLRLGDKVIKYSNKAKDGTPRDKFDVTYDNGNFRVFYDFDRSGKIGDDEKDYIVRQEVTKNRLELGDYRFYKHVTNSKKKMEEVQQLNQEYAGIRKAFFSALDRQKKK